MKMPKVAKNISLPISIGDIRVNGSNTTNIIISKTTAIGHSTRPYLYCQSEFWIYDFVYHTYYDTWRRIADTESKEEV